MSIISIRKGKPFDTRQLAPGEIRSPRIKLGLGDRIAKIATPIAKVLKSNCIDQITGQLKPESGCGKRRQMLNRIRI